MVCLASAGSVLTLLHVKYDVVLQACHYAASVPRYFRVVSCFTVIGVWAAGLEGVGMIVCGIELFVMTWYVLGIQPVLQA